MIGDARRLASYHLVTMYAAVFFAFLSVAFDGAGLVIGAVFVASLPVSWWFSRRGHADRLPAQTWNVLILLAIFATAARMFLADDSLLSSGIQFILVLLVLKLFGRKGARDEWQIYALTFLVMAAGTAVNEDIAYGAVFACYVLVSTFGLTLFHLKSEVEMTRSASRQTLGRGYVGALAALALAVFASSVFLFFALPRVGLGFFATKDRSPTSMTGFNDSVELGSHGAIRSNPEVVMRVTFPDGEPPPQHDYEGYHWRVMSFDTYDGVRWSRDLSRQSFSIAPKSDEEDAVRELSALQPELVREQGGELERVGVPHEVYLEPLGTEQVPVLSPVHSIQVPDSLNVPFSPRYTVAFYDGYYGDVLLRSRNELGTSYTIWKGKNYRQPPDQVPDTEVWRGLDSYLQLPRGHERLVALSTSLTDAIEEPVDKADAVIQYLNANYSYTLDLPPVDPEKPVESFLFDTKRGHCEFFATSMALMMRASGVRARVVNGFLGGTWNEVGGYVAVRQADAHAWVEIYVPGRGWIAFDPTPASEAELRLGSDPGPMRWLRNSYDTMRMTWMQWVIEYDLDTQIKTARRIGQALTPTSTPFDSAGDDSEEDEVEKTNIPTRLIVLFGGWLFLCVVAWNTGRLTRERALWTSVLGAGVAGAAGGGWVGWFYAFETGYVVAGAAGPLVLGLLGRAVGSSWSSSGSRSSASKLFVRVERAAARVGVERREDEGADQFLRRLSSSFPAARTPLESFRSRYLRARYGGKPLSSAERAEMLRWLKDAIQAMNGR